MIYTKMKIKDIKPYENNPRINDEAVEDVAESIRQCGYIAPIVVDENGVILAGHTRLKALKNLGKTSCEVVVVEGLDEEQKKKYRLYDNKTAEFAEWDMEKLNDELFGIDFEGFNFGQPKLEDNEEDDDHGPKEETVTCPCCGEVFSVWN